MVNKILITGGNGYIGSRLSIYLAERGYAVSPLCNPEAPLEKDWISKMEQVLVGDIRDEAFINTLSKNNYDIVIHLVSLDQKASNASPAFVNSINVTPTWSLLDIFSKQQLKSFIYFSTVQVYNPNPNMSFSELSPVAPHNSYALTHLLSENICNYYTRTSSTICSIVRLSNSYGSPTFMENNCWWLVINDLCRMALQNNEIILQSNGSPQRDFIHGWDVCAAVHRIIESETYHPLYNISSGQTLTIMEIAQKVLEVYYDRYHKKLPLIVKSGIYTPPANRYVIENKLLQSIGFTQEWTLERGINDLFNYLEKH